MKQIIFVSLLLAIVCLIPVSCGQSYQPKPRAYFRIQLPPKEYREFNSAGPFRFSYPVYAEIAEDCHPLAGPYWINVKFPQFDATLHITYKPINNNLGQYLDDMHRMLSKLIPKATGIKEDKLIDNEARVFGTIFYISGPGVASTCQFFLTDSVNHFLRGALYFDVTPNNDSLAPVIEFLREDILYLGATLQWE